MVMGKMNPRRFLKEFASSEYRSSLEDKIYDEMAAYCREEGVTTNEISNAELEELATGLVSRGLGED
jgi:hypothetical protein